MMKTKSQPKSQPKKRVLTHALLYDKQTKRWSCKCGYVLGDGHSKLYALCPLKQRDKVEAPEPKLKQSVLAIIQAAIDFGVIT